jgi:serine/threonine protein kinase
MDREKHLTPERWRDVKAALDRLAGLGAEGRAVALAELRALDAELAVEAESLLAAHPPDSFLQSPPVTPPQVESGMRFGPYEVVDLLGRGGMGEVWRARDTTLRRDVALKMLSGDVAQDPARLARLRKEAQVLASLNHPYVGAIYGFEGSGPTPALVLELVQGQTLATRLSRGPLPVRDALRLSGQIAEALEAAHEHGIVHRDLKPGNVMLRPDGMVKVLDFGLATPGFERIGGVATSPLTQPGAVVGTPAYMAPEQARGEPVDHRADIWAFGCVLYEMLRGRSAFGAPTVAESLANVLEGRVDLNALPGDTPPSIRRLVRRCLAPSVRNRLQHIGDARADVVDELADTGSGVIAAAPTSTQKTRYLTAVAIVVGLAVVAAAAFVLLKPDGGDGPDDAQLSLPVPVPLTTSGNAAMAAISPDGRYVAYVQRDRDADSVWVRQTTTTSNTPTQIVESEPGARIVGLTVSPDGVFVDFLRQTTLYRVPLHGGAVTKRIDQVHSAIGWSPDRANPRFAFLRRHPPNVRDVSLVVVDADDLHEEVLSRPATSEHVFDSAPVWSPDGATIATAGVRFLERKGRTGWVMFVTVRDGSVRAEPLTPQSSGGAWASDATMFWSRSAGTEQPSQLWSMSYPSVRLRRLTNDLGGYGRVSLSADGDSLVTDHQTTESHIWVGDANGEGSPLDTFAPLAVTSAFGAQLAWLGDQVIYGARRGEELGLWAVQRGGNARELIRNAGVPTTTADAAVIVYNSYDEDAPYALWKADRDGLKREKLTDDAYWPVMTPDGREVIFVTPSRSTEVALWRKVLATGEERQITNVDSRNPDVSPDGKLLAFVSSPDPGKPTVLLVCELPGCASPRPLRPTGMPPRVSTIRWTADSRSIAYVNQTADGGPNIWLQPLDSRLPAKALTKFTDGWRIGSFAFSRDGRLAILRVKTRTDIVLFRGILNRPADARSIR